MYIHTDTNTYMVLMITAGSEDDYNAKSETEIYSIGSRIVNLLFRPSVAN